MASKKLKKYVQIDRLKKKLVELENLRKPYIKKLMRRAAAQGILVPGISYYTRENLKIDENEVTEYVRDLCREACYDDSGEVLLDEDGNPIFKVNEVRFSKFCKQVLDLEKLEPVGKALGLEIFPLPSCCYTIDTSEVIKIDHKKVKKNG